MTIKKIRERDVRYVRDMLDSALTVQEFMAGMRFDEFMRDRILQVAIERNAEIMCEVSRRISEEFKQAYPEIPWSRIISEGKVIADEYDDVKQERMWLVATILVPFLIPQLEAALPPPPKE